MAHASYIIHHFDIMKYFFHVYYYDKEVSNGSLFDASHDCPSLDDAYMYAFSLACSFRRRNWRVFCNFDTCKQGDLSRFSVRLLDFSKMIFLKDNA